MLLVQHSRPIASAEIEDHRMRRIMLIGLRVSFSRTQRLARPITPDARNHTTKIVLEVYSASMTIRLLEQWL